MARSKSKSPTRATTGTADFEIDLDPGADGLPMEVEGAVGASAKTRKGRGFNQRREREGGLSEGFDRVESTHGQAQKSVEGWIVLITNVHEELTEEDLMEVFAEYGPIKNLHLNLDRRTGYVKGYALVEYPELLQAKAAIKAKHNADLQGKRLSCDFAFVKGSGAASSSKQTFKSAPQSARR